MTREEAIKILKAIRVYECYPKSASEETKEAIDMAIEALSAEAAIGDYPNDLISRSALMEYCSNQKSKSIDNNDIARFPSAEARPTQARNCDGCDMFTMAEELAKASIDACADEIVRQIKDSRVECKDCKHHHTSEMYGYCDLIAVKGRRQRVMKYCSLGERR